MPVSELISKVHTFVVEPLLFLLFGAAFIIFIWGIVEFIQNTESDEGRETGKRNMIWGIIGMVIMVSAIGIVNIILGTFDIEKPEGADDIERTFQGDIDRVQVE